MKVAVDRTLCESNGVCVGAAPEVFDLTDDDELVVLQPEPGDQLRQSVDYAVRSCPRQALSVAE